MNRLLLVGLALLAGALILRQRGHESLRLRHDNATTQTRCADTSNQLASAELRAEQLRTDLQHATTDRSLALAELARLGRPNPEPPPDPESRWSRPPDTLPQWNPESPFVWLDKSLLPRLRTTAFQPDGTLSPGVGAVLTIDDARQAALNQNTSALVAEYRQQELAHARLVEDHLPEVAHREGRKITLRIEPMPETTTRLRGAFEQALVEHLGPQRAKILAEASADWISQMFPATQANPRTISIVLDSQGHHHVATRNSFGTMSASGPGDFRVYIPKHLQPLVEDWQSSAPPPNTP